jgi:hypothetical protein
LAVGQRPQPNQRARHAPRRRRGPCQCFDCSAACTSLRRRLSRRQDVRALVRCIRLNHDCADACDAAGRILTRQTASDVGVLRAAIQACAAACRACGEECERHAEHHEHCRVCSRACARCEQACNDLEPATFEIARTTSPHACSRITVRLRCSPLSPEPLNMELRMAPRVFRQQFGPARSGILFAGGICLPRQEEPVIL